MRCGPGAALRHYGHRSLGLPPLFWSRGDARAIQPARPGAAAQGRVEPVSLSLVAQGIKLEPLPLRAGFPFTITILIHNKQPVAAVGVPVMVYLSAMQEEVGFGSFFRVLTVTVPATGTLAVKVPVIRNLAGGEYRLWVQVNR